jgi:Divergent InlB B-repeat domain
MASVTPDPLQLKRHWKGGLVNGIMRAFIIKMAAMVMISGAKASSISLAEEITDLGVSTTVALTVERGKPSGNFQPGTQVLVTANDPPPGAQFANWTGDVEILANPALSLTTATIPFMAVKITATYTAPETTPAETGPSTPLQTPNTATTRPAERPSRTDSNSASTDDPPWGG